MRRAYCKKKLSAGCVLVRNGEIQLLKKGGADWSVRYVQDGDAMYNGRLLFVLNSLLEEIRLRISMINYVSKWPCAFQQFLLIPLKLKCQANAHETYKL